MWRKSDVVVAKLQHSSPSAAGAATALARTTSSRRSPPSESAAAPARYPSPRHRVPTSAAVDDGGNRLREGDDAGQARTHEAVALVQHTVAIITSKRKPEIPSELVGVELWWAYMRKA